jgi:hypothetical protein
MTAGGRSTLPAATVSSICCGLRAPAIALVIAGSRSAHASTSCATLIPRRAAIGRRPSTSCRFSESSGSWKNGWRLRQSSGLSAAARSRVNVPVSSPECIGL